MARPTLLPQCTSCIRRVTRLGLDARSPLQHQVRNKTNAAKQEERNVIVKLRHDVRGYGRAGSYVPINPSTMRNRWFPMRAADYVPIAQLKQLQAQEVDMTRDVAFGMKFNLEEVEETKSYEPRRQYVRPIEIEALSPERSMELIDTFLSATIDFARQPIEQEKEQSQPQYGASDAADILTAAVMSSKPKPAKNGIYGSVSTADVAATIKTALAHNDEAARVIISEADVKFLTGHEGDDTSRVKQLGTYRVEIRVPGAETTITRNIRVRAKEQQ